MADPDTIPLQRDIFTGETVDTRSTSQKKADLTRQAGRQTMMFSFAEAPIAKNTAKPVVDVSHLATPELELICEDPRTEEEKEIARRKAMEADTFRMFDDPTLYDNEDSNTIPSDQREYIPIPETVTALLSPAFRLHDEIPPKEAAYLEVVAAFRDAQTSLWTDRLYASRMALHIPMAVQAALHAELTTWEIEAAIHVGHVLALQDSQQYDPFSEPPSASVSEDEPASCQSAPRGLRAQLRQQSVSLRSR